MVDSGEKWGIKMFMGEYHHSIDEKGRIIIPSKFRCELGDKFIVTRGIENCLFAYPEKEWDKIVEKLNKLPFTKKDARNFSRFFLSGATIVEFDKQGRINLPKNLIEHADIEKVCYLIGVSNRFEIWSEANWVDFTDEAEGTFEDIAEDLIDFGF